MIINFIKKQLLKYRTHTKIAILPQNPWTIYEFIRQECEWLQSSHIAKVFAHFGWWILHGYIDMAPHNSLSIAYISYHLLKLKTMGNWDIIAYKLQETQVRNNKSLQPTPFYEGIVTCYKPSCIRLLDSWK